MKFDFKNRGFVVITLSAMLIAVGVINYQLSKQSALTVSKKFEAYEQAQQDKNTDKDSNKNSNTSNNDKNTDNQSETAQITVVDSKDSENDKIKEKATGTSKQIEEQLTSKENMNKSTYVLDMKMTREKQRNSLTEQLNEIINNPSTADAAKVEASNIKVEMVKNSDTELKIENLLLAKGYDQAIVFIDSDKVNVVVNMEEITQNDATKIFDIVSNQSGINRENIKLTNNR